jgi:hypothetical protein
LDGFGGDGLNQNELKTAQSLVKYIFTRGLFFNDEGDSIYFVGLGMNWVIGIQN